MQQEHTTNTPNRLIHAQSPYLLQHAHNPVDWREWNPESLAEAITTNRPIFLSVGYSACHWCHVMEHESFADPVIASIMNESFVCIKVDREERPDVDSVYMTALQRLTGQGGWPMSMFLTPQGEPFYGGTYYPPQDRGQMPGFGRVLRSVATAWRDREHELRQAGQDLQGEITLMMGIPGADAVPDAAMLEECYTRLSTDADYQWGGYGGAPKFPPSMLIQALHRAHQRGSTSPLIAHARLTLDRMASGGIYDQLGGGFHRYSVDGEWRVPHFEKMLYDNGLLLLAYSEAYHSDPQPRYAQVVAETCAWLMREMRLPDGSFAAALDADSDGEEGKFYTWEAAEFGHIAGADTPLGIRYFAMGDTPDLDGNYVLQYAGLPDDEPSDQQLAQVSALRQRLLGHRDQRTRPACDDKCIASWNGLAIVGLVAAGRVWDNPRWIQAATDALTAVHTVLWHDGVLYRNARQGTRSAVVGFLEDYANIAEAAFAVGMATADARWLQWGQVLVKEIMKRFYDASSQSFYDTSDLHHSLIVRPRERADHATPSGTATALEVLLQCAEIFSEPYYVGIVEEVLAHYTSILRRWPQGFGKILSVSERLVADAIEIVHAGPQGPLWQHIQRHAPLMAVVVKAEALPNALLCQNKASIDGQETVYVCRNMVCQRPVTRLDDLKAMLR